MKKIILIAAFITFYFQLSTFNCSAQTPDWIWAKDAAGTGNDIAASVVLYASGNIYVAGYFLGTTITFGSTTLTNADNTGSTADMFLAKFDNNGNVLWAKSIGGNEDDEANAIAADAAGNIYIAGSFKSALLSFGSTTLTNTNLTLGYANVFLAKYDANGNPIWATSTGGVNYDDYASSLTVDGLGNIYVAGTFGTASITFGSTTLNNYGYDDIFLAKYNSNGTSLWAESAGGAENDYVNSIATDRSGNVYLTGEFGSENITFGSTVLTNVASFDIFITKYDSTGNVVWSRSAGGDDADDATSVAVDTAGNTYITGNFYSSTLTFGGYVLTNVGENDIFIAKYDTAGNAIWGKSIGGTGFDNATSIAVDSSGSIYVAGYFQSPTLAFNTTILTNAVDTGVFYDLFVAKFYGNSHVAWAKSAGGTDDDYATAIAVNQSGNTYVAGNFKSPSIAFGSTTLTNAGLGYSDIFISKLTAVAGGISEYSNPLDVSVYPNPTTDNLTIETSQQATIDIINIEGQTLESFAANSNKTTIDVSALPGGIYIIKISSDKGISVKKFIKE